MAILASIAVLVDNSAMQFWLFSAMHSLTFVLLVGLKPFANRWVPLSGMCTTALFSRVTGGPPTRLDVAWWLNRRSSIRRDRHREVKMMSEQKRVRIVGVGRNMCRRKTASLTCERGKELMRPCGWRK